MAFLQEFSRAVAVLNDYYQTEDSIWLMDLIQSADSTRVELLEVDPVSEWNSGESSSFQEMNISFLYRKGEYEGIIQQSDTLNLEKLSGKGLFFVSSSALKLNLSTPFRDQIEAELYRRYQLDSLDPFGLYNLGIIWKQKNDSRSRSALLTSIHLFPYFWSCWLELSNIFLSFPYSKASYNTICTPCVLKNFFQLQTVNHLLQSHKVRSLFSTLSSFFPTSNYLLIQLAQFHYNHARYDDALSILRAIDVSSIHSMLDRYPYEILLCNVLFVLKKAQELLELSQRVLYAPIQPLVEGSYWSLVGQHTKSILCFTSIITRYPSYYDGWLLLGHEYLSAGDRKAAVACYFKATHLNGSDYRAFFALAQVYAEMNHNLAYYFFMRTVSIQQQFTRGWLFLGDFLATYYSKEKAMDAYRRGQRCSDIDEHESRICLLRLCAMQMQDGSEDWEDMTNWVSRATEAKDPEVYSPEGLEVVRYVLQGCHIRGEKERGVAICKFLIMNTMEPGLIQEMTKNIQIFQSGDSVNMSVSMDCSE